MDSKLAPILRGKTSQALYPRVEKVTIVFLAIIVFLQYFGFKLASLHWRFDDLLGSQEELKGTCEIKPWCEITPTKHLVYHPCFDGLQCARLEVPMDYNSTNSNESKVAIAMVKVPAKVPVTDPRYGGVILINPGGPGGSGIEKILGSGKQVQAIVDAQAASLNEPISSQDKYFDIIGFDPRGINRTTPYFNCFPHSLSRGIWVLQSEAEGLIGTSDSALDIKWSRIVSLSQGCASRYKRDDQDSIAYHMNTPVVVTDMVEIVERHGEWREAQAIAWLESHEGQKLTYGRSQHDLKSRNWILQRTRWRKGQEQLQYWGVSYGTTIGTTFASIYPQRSSRLVLDGVMAVEEHYEGTWLSSLQDTDLILGKFFEYCQTAGTAICPMNVGSSSEDIKNLFMNIYAQLQNGSLPIPGSGNLAADVLNVSDLKVLMRASFYDPIGYFPVVAKLLSSFSEGDLKPFGEFKQLRREVEAFWPLSRPFIPSEQCKIDGPFSEACQSPNEYRSDPQVAIQCTDAKRVVETKESFEEYAKILHKQSEWLGNYWPELRLSCVGWDIRPKWEWNGPFTGNLTHPMLLIGNTWDPVTPLENAHHVAKGFNGSTVLEQESAGHGTLSSPSICSAKTIRQYFQTGELPKEGTVCKPDELPFMGSGVSVEMMSEEDRRLLGALQSLRRAHGKARYFG